MAVVVGTSSASRLVEIEVVFPGQVSDSSTAKNVSTAATTLSTGYSEPLTGLFSSTTLEMNGYVHTYIYMCVCIYVHTYLPYVCICIYIYAYVLMFCMYEFIL